MSSVHALVVALVDGGRIDEAHRIAQQAMRGDPANEHLVALVRELRIQNHWSMKPLWPLQKWGWGASAAMWMGGIVVIRGLQGRARTCCPVRSAGSRTDLQLGLAAAHPPHPVNHRTRRLAELEAQLLRDPFNTPRRLEYARLLLAAGRETAALKQYDLARKSAARRRWKNSNAARASAGAAAGAREPVKLSVVQGARSADVVSIARPVAAPDKTRFMHIAGMEDLKKSIRLQIIEPFLNPGAVRQVPQEGGRRHPAVRPAGLRQDHAGARRRQRVQRQLPRHRHLGDPHRCGSARASATWR